MRALTTKLRRDLWSLRGPAVAIAVVLGCGVAAYVGSRSTMDALVRTQAAFYRTARFADVFASATRAPERLLAEIRAIPGVTAAETRVKGFASVDVEGFDEPVSALVASLPDEGEPLLNGLYLVAGRLPEPGRADEAVLSDAFAEAHGLRPGDHLGAVLRGRQRRLTVVGVARSPEFLFQVPPGAMLPDFERFAIVWMRRAPLAAAYDLRGAFNDVALRLAPGTPPEPVLDRLDALLAPYGGANAVARADQPSHFYVSEELRQLRQTTRVLPAMFIGVAVFLLAVVVGRLVQTQREQIATLKAFGYGTAAVAAHYVQMVGVIVALGAALGVALGVWMGTAMAELYASFYRFPEIRYALAPRVVIEAVGLAALAALAATLRAVWGAASLPPAVAKREPSPTRYRPSVVERLGLRDYLGEPERMILRHLERRPFRALLSVAGIAMACAIVLLGRFSGDAMDRMLDVQFGWAHREDLDVAFTEAAPDAARLELAALPGVQYAEGYRTVGVELVNGPRRHTTAVVGMDRSGDLSRVLTADLRPVTLPPDGLVLADHLARKLGVAVGDTLRVEVLGGDRRARDVVVARLVREYVGTGVYMERRALNRLLGEGDLVSGAWLAADPEALPALVAALDARPGVLRATALPQARAALEETFVRSAAAFSVILTLLAVAIAFGVLYNTARLTLAERSRELASLRVLGFTTAEVAYLFFGELTVLTLAALPVGLALGTAFCYGYIEGLQTDIVRIPFVLTRASYAFTAAVVLGSAAASALPMARRLRRLDLVAVLKVRE